MEEYKTLMESFLEMHQRLNERTERAKDSLAKEKEKNDLMFSYIITSFRQTMEEVSDLLLLCDTKVVRRISISIGNLNLPCFRTFSGVKTSQSCLGGLPTKTS